MSNPTTEHSDGQAAEPPEAGSDALATHNPTSTSRGWRFWVIFVALCVTALLASVEATVVSTTLGSIAREIHVGENYPWVVNAFWLTSTISQPIYGQLADLLGRRWVTMSAVAFLMLGSVISGGAINTNMLLAGRAIQGAGCGGVNLLIDLITCDLVPLKERPKFIGLVRLIFGIGTAMGPFIGGAIVQHSSWRWVFYLNLPIGGVSMLLLFLFLRVKYRKASFKERMSRFDYTGSFMLVTSTIAVVFALTYAGSKYAWSSWHTLVPLVLGIVGIISFHGLEASRLVKEPLAPPHIFSNRTSAIAFFITFVHALVFVWVIYFLPLYFQAVLGSSPTRAGVQLLPTVLALMPFAIVGAQILEKTGKYRPVHFAGLAIMTLGLGTFSLLKNGSSQSLWVGLQVLQIAGTGLVFTALLPAIQANLSDKDNAASTATFSYIRSYGVIWGITIPVSIFNNEFDKRLGEISDVHTRNLLAGGKAYSLGSPAFLSTLPTEVKNEVVHVYVQSLRTMWIVAAAICAATCLLSLAEKETALRTDLDTEYGLEEKPRSGPKKNIDMEKL